MLSRYDKPLKIYRKTFKEFQEAIKVMRCSAHTNGHGHRHSGMDTSVHGCVCLYLSEGWCVLACMRLDPLLHHPLIL